MKFNELNSPKFSIPVMTMIIIIVVQFFIIREKNALINNKNYEIAELTILNSLMEIKKAEVDSAMAYFNKDRHLFETVLANNIAYESKLKYMADNNNVAFLVKEEENIGGGE